MSRADHSHRRPQPRDERQEALLALALLAALVVPEDPLQRLLLTLLFILGLPVILGRPVIEARVVQGRTRSR